MGSSGVDVHMNSDVKSAFDCGCDCAIDLAKIRLSFAQLIRLWYGNVTVACTACLAKAGRAESSSCGEVDLITTRITQHQEKTWKQR